MNFSRLFVFAGLLTGAACVQAAPVVAPTVALPAESNGLKISISPTSNSAEERTILLRRGAPQINVVLQNTSNKPMLIDSDFGFGLMLEVTALDGRVLDATIQVRRTFASIAGKLPQPDIIEAGGAIVREVQLNLPTKASDPTNQFGGRALPNVGYRYSDFPFPPFPQSYGSRMITMRAVLSDDTAQGDRNENNKPIWMGKIASPLESYRVFWGAD